MSGFNKSDNSIATGIPARHIGPETGSSGNATMTNRGGASEGANEAFEKRSFAGTPKGEPTGPLDAAEQSPARQIADGGDRIRHDVYDDDDLNDSKGG